MPYKDRKRSQKAAAESDKRQGRRIVTINLDARTAAALDKAVEQYGGRAQALRELLKNF